MSRHDLEIETIYKSEAKRVLATLVRILGDLDLAEEALQEAFLIALEKWSREGIPKNPHAWLVSAGKFKAIDGLRRDRRAEELLANNFPRDSGGAIGDAPESGLDNHLIEDDRLRLIFYCCHPDLPLESRIALALREVCGLRTEEIARAYLLPVETIKKRISRAKEFLREKKFPYEIPSLPDLRGRLDAVLHVLYLIFNEGYAASAGKHHIRTELTGEAILLCREVVDLLPTAEGCGLLALLLLHESRSQARVTEEGDIIPLEEQDRSRWDRHLIQEGLSLLHRAIMTGRLGPYCLQAAIASVHAQADSVRNTEWSLIVGYYDILVSIHPAPAVELNRAIAVGMHAGPEAGLALLARLMENEQLAAHHTIHSARAEFSRQLGRVDEALASYRRALALVRQEPEERYLKRQIAAILK